MPRTPKAQRVFRGTLHEVLRVQKRSQTHAKAPTVHVNCSVPWIIMETQITQHTPPLSFPPPNVCSMNVCYINSRNNYSPLSRCTNELTEEGGGVCGAAEERRRADLEQNNTSTGYLERRERGPAGTRWLERFVRAVLAEGSQPVSFYNISVDLRCVASRER